MQFKKMGGFLRKIVEYPKILPGRLKGLQSDHLLCCLTAKDLVNKPFKTIIDVGTNKGDFIDVCNYLFSKLKIYAFEPIPELYKIIKNKKNVIAFNLGLWDKKEEGVLYCHKTHMGASSFLCMTKEYKKTRGGTKKDLFKIKAKKIQFDKLNLPIQRPCFVKIDVEGAEEKVIKGFGNRLKEVDVLQIEWFFVDFFKNQMKLGRLFSFLEKQGFVGFIQREVLYINKIPSSCDLIFFKSKNVFYLTEGQDGIYEEPW